MSLKVIGAGFGRTGTLSLKTALEQLGFSKCHHMQEVFRSRRQVDLWNKASLGENVDWDDVFEGYAASCDWPSAAYWEQLYACYPDCKVILTLRDESRWYRSTAETIHPFSMSIPTWLTWVVPRARVTRNMVVNTVWNGVFHGRFEDEAYATRVFRENSERVQRVVAPDRLLIFEAKDGWEPLCAFLGVPVPETPYPHVNEAATIKRVVRVLGVIRWLPLIVLAMIVLPFIL